MIDSDDEAILRHAAWCRDVRTAPQLRRYFGPVELDPDHVQRTTEYFNYLGLTHSAAADMLSVLETKVKTALQHDGVNGGVWQRMLDQREQEWADYLHLFDYLSNSGMVALVQVARQALLPPSNTE
ncbi:MAG TPA: hypothetical protein VJK52_00290 [Candidatus Nanoarchaeia archaeon]|nr:hypothetical protein [Candidatus Nanoarchaeia archaeon]